MGEEKRREEGGTVESPVATVGFLLSISLLHNPFSQYSLRTSGPAALTRLNPLVTHTHTEILFNGYKQHTHAHRRIISTSKQHKEQSAPPYIKPKCSSLSGTCSTSFSTTSLDVKCNCTRQK